MRNAMLHAVWLFLLVAGLCAAAEEPLGKPLPGTSELKMQGDLAEQMVAGIDRFPTLS